MPYIIVTSQELDQSQLRSTRRSHGHPVTSEHFGSSSRDQADMWWQLRRMESELSRMLSHELALDILEIGSVPAFRHLAINKSAARMNVEADLPPRRGYTHKVRPRVGCADIQICFDDIISLEPHSRNKNMFIGNG